MPSVTYINIMPCVSAGGNQSNRSNRLTTGSNNAHTRTEMNDTATNNSEKYYA